MMMSKQLREIAAELAHDAVMQHEEGVQFAADILQASLDEEGKSSRDNNLQISYRPYTTQAGEGTVVSILDKTPGYPVFHLDPNCFMCICILEINRRLAMLALKEFKQSCYL